METERGEIRDVSNMRQGEAQIKVTKKCDRQQSIVAQHACDTIGGDEFRSYLMERRRALLTELDSVERILKIK